MATSERDYGIAPAGFRLPDRTRVGRVRLQVADLDRSLDFYHGVLGLEVLEREGKRASLGAPEVAAGTAASTPLVELHERPGAAPVPRRGRLGLFHFAVLLPDRSSLARLIRALAEKRIPFGASDHLVSEALYLSDPDGLGVEVYADRPSSEWERSDRQLVMATDPLDLDDLGRAAGPDPWAGIPAGTSIGHVHLHVGDLDQAAAFYHAGLGLDLTVWSYPGALFLSAGGYHHHLGVNTWARGAKPPEEDEARLLEWELVLPSAEQCGQAMEKLAGTGQTVERQEDSGGVVQDPWGTPLRIRAESA